MDSIRSENETDQRGAISQIPKLILNSLQHRHEVLNHLLLVLYNLNTNSEKYEVLNAVSRTQVFRHLLRLYTESIREHQDDQLDALTKLVDLIHCSDLLIELAYALHKCSETSTSKKFTDAVNEALESIREKASANLHTEALLMVHSIIAMK